MNCFLKLKAKIKVKGKEIPPESPLELGINQGGSTSNIVSIKKQQDLRVFSLVELKKATKNFSPSLKIGGGYDSTYYKGTLKDHGAENITVAIANPDKGHSPALDLVKLIGGVDHPNLLKLLGYCLDDGTRGNCGLLVYEYMPNNSLYHYLFEYHPAALTWETRLQIMLGTAEGVAYLHEGLQVPIIHRDFKPSAVLLDMNFRAKLSDFSLARSGPCSDESHVTTRVMGTCGYADPVYLCTGHLTLKSDIYSYGVVLYEILTGRRVIDIRLPDQERNLVDWVKRHPAKGKRFYKMLDPRLHNNYPKKEAVMLAQLADRCTSHNPEDRPTMREIITILRVTFMGYKTDLGVAAEFKKTFSVSDKSGGIGRLNSPPTSEGGAYSDPDLGSKSIAELEDTVSECASLSELSECQLSPHSPCEIVELLASTPTGIGPVWKEYHPTPQHPQPAAPIHFKNSDYNEYRLDPDKEVEAKRLLFLFGEGYEFEKQMLIQLWMGLRLLTDEPMEVIGAYCFENLLSEGYIVCSVANSLYKVNSIKLTTEWHTNNQNYIRLDNQSQNSDTSTETLHASVVCDEITVSTFQTLGGFKRLKTLLFLGNYGPRLQQVPRDLFLHYECLEALDLSGTGIKELPSSAGKMINLRYLDLSWTLLEALPERIDLFKSLQTLKLEGCSRLHRLPKEMKGLTNLRHLHLDVLGQLAAFPEGMGALVNIRTLSAFPVSTEQGLRISELKYLNNITGSFCVAKIENVQSADEAKEASLTTKRNIKKLKLRWSKHKVQHCKNEDESILQSLCPGEYLEELQILCYPGTRLPDWMADVKFDRLISISLFGCARLAMLPSLDKLRSLVSLELIGLNSVTKMDFKGAADYAGFPKLEKLTVDGMLNLETWAEDGGGDYPCLVELSIKDCPKLLQFPFLVYVPILKHLEISGCSILALVSDEILSPSLQQLIVEDCSLIEDMCCKDGGRDWHKIQHVPNIWINQVAIQTQTHEDI